MSTNNEEIKNLLEVSAGIFENKPKVYLAGPIDNTDDPSEYREQVKEYDLGEEVEWIDPLDDIDGTAVDTGVFPPEEAGYLAASMKRKNAGDEVEIVYDDELTETDYGSIDECDAIIVCGWDVEVPARGTASELEYNSNNGDVPVFMWGQSSYLELSPFIRMNVGVYSPNLDVIMESVRDTLW